MDTIYVVTDTIASKCIMQLSPVPATTVVEKVATNPCDLGITITVVSGAVILAALAMYTMKIWLSWRTSYAKELKETEARLSSELKNADLTRKIKEYKDYEKIRLTGEFELKKDKDKWEMIDFPNLKKECEKQKK